MALDLHLEIIGHQLEDETVTTDRLQQPWAKRRVHTHRQPNHEFREVIDRLVQHVAGGQQETRRSVPQPYATNLPESLLIF